MRTGSRCGAVVACLTVLMLFVGTSAAQVGGGQQGRDETGLHPFPDLSLTGQGLTVSAAGTGLRGTPMPEISHPGSLDTDPDGLGVPRTGLDERVGTIEIGIDGPVLRAYLYWAGSGQVEGEQELLLDDELFIGERIGVEMRDDLGIAIAYRADVTDFVEQVVRASEPDGGDVYTFTVVDPSPEDNLDAMHGATLFVVYTNEADPSFYRLITFDGADFAFAGFAPGENSVTTPIGFVYGAEPVFRVAQLIVVVGEATDQRPDLIEVVSEGTFTIVNGLDASDGPFWDTDRYNVPVPMNSSESSVEVISPSEYAQPDSLAWVVGALRIPIDSIGACCFFDGTCIDQIEEDECTMLGGVNWFEGASCEPGLCLPLGACCFTDCSPCQELTEEDCDALGGIFQGDGTPCDAVFCPEFGACCLESGFCEITTENQCDDLGGLSWHACTPCEDAPCPTPGACCFFDGSCVDGITQSACFDDPDAVSWTPNVSCGDVQCEVLGACCLFDGECVELTQEDCLDDSGLSWNQGVRCEDTVCPVFGACCFFDGSCAELTEADCTGQGGMTWNEGLMCDEAVCPVFGACCFYDGGCADLPEMECFDQGGLSFTPAIPCNEFSCPVFGACCFFDGSCAELTEVQCDAQGGLSWNAGMMCDEVICPIFGACCFFDGSCAELTEADCTAQGGMSWTEGLMCDEASCPAFGACCFCDGSCTELTETDCTAQGGVSWTPAVQCGDIVCEPVGACCHECDGTCEDGLTQADCEAQDGVWQGACTSCDGADCAAIGACCLDEETCVDGLTPDECAAQGGVYKGDCTTCDEVNCTGPIGRVSCTEKGSLLVFSAVEVRWSPNGELVQDTFIQLTNDYPDDAQVLMYFVHGDRPLPPNGDERPHTGWNSVDNEITLTANQTVYWSVLSGQPQGVSPWTVLDPGSPPGRPAMDGSNERVLRGYVLAWAVGSLGEEIRFNHLSGLATTINYVRDFAWESTACAYQVVDPSVAHGEATGTPGVLNLDGIEYASSVDLLLFNFAAEGATSLSGPRLVTTATDLTLHPATVDLRQETVGRVITKAHIDVWNENEVKFSGSYRCIECWDQSLLSMYGIPNHFLVEHLQTDFGKARIDGQASSLCPGSRVAALHGVEVTLLVFDAGLDVAASGGNLFGMGLEDAVIRFDPVGPPPEFPLPSLDPTKDDLERFLDSMLGEGKK